MSTSADKKSVSDERDAQLLALLAKELQKTAEEIAAKTDGKGRMTVAPLRVLQDQLGLITEESGVPRSAVFLAFVLDLMISDAFKNMFGDTPWDDRTAIAQEQLTKEAAALLRELSAALSSEDRERQLSALQDYVSAYLKLIRDLNGAWLTSRFAREGSAIT